MDLLKQRLAFHYGENATEYDPEEVNEVMTILSEYDDNLSGLNKIVATLLCRLINDDELYAEVDEMVEDEDFNENPFD